MLEIKTEENAENEAPKENIESTAEENNTTTAEEANALAVAAAADAPEPSAAPQATPNLEQTPIIEASPPNIEPASKGSTLNPLNELEPNVDTEAKAKHRRYWTPKEEERFYEIWGRENWRLTRHGKNTIFFAQWAEEMKERFGIDVKPEEIQCKVNQTRAKFRSVKKHLEADKNAAKWKKYDIVERILKNQYRSKNDEPVPVEALENNRDVSPTELLNCVTQPSSPSSISNMSNLPETNINLSQSLNADHQLADEVNMSSVSLSDQNLFCNNSQSGNSFSTDLFGGDQLEIKQEIEMDIKQEGFTELSMMGNTALDGGDIDMANNNTQLSQLHQQLTQPLIPPPVPQASMENSQTMEPLIHSSNPNSLLIQNRLVQNHNNTNNINEGFTNHNSTSMQPPKALAVAASPRKRNRSSSISGGSGAGGESLESMYMDEVRKKNILLVEQGEINRKRLRLEERKVKLMEEFFPKFMNLQQDILTKLENVTNSPREITKSPADITNLTE